jgi:hypothetical protein
MTRRYELASTMRIALGFDLDVLLQGDMCRGGYDLGSRQSVCLQPSKSVDQQKLCHAGRRSAPVHVNPRRRSADLDRHDFSTRYGLLTLCGQSHSPRISHVAVDCLLRRPFEQLNFQWPTIGAISAGPMHHPSTVLIDQRQYRIFVRNERVLHPRIRPQKHVHRLRHRRRVTRNSRISKRFSPFDVNNRRPRSATFRPRATPREVR